MILVGLPRLDGDNMFLSANIKMHIFSLKVLEMNNFMQHIYLNVYNTVN